MSGGAPAEDLKPRMNALAPNPTPGPRPATLCQARVRTEVLRVLQQHTSRTWLAVREAESSRVRSTLSWFRPGRGWTKEV